MSPSERDSPDPGDPVLRERRGPVLILTLNRPHRLNAVSLPLYESLTASLEEAAGDPGVRAVVLTGAGRAFCAGADLKAHGEGPPSPAERRRYAQAAQEANRLVQEGPVPVVAAVNGHAVGAGLELALSADFVLVAREARLRLPEVVLGTFVGGGVTYTLPQRVGIRKAREILFFGEFFSGQEAAEWGVADRALPGEAVLSEALSWAERLAAAAPLSLAAARAMLGPAGPVARDRILEEEAAVLERLFGTRDWAEGIAAFAEKRPPRFEGR